MDFEFTSRPSSFTKPAWASGDEDPTTPRKREYLLLVLWPKTVCAKTRAFLCPASLTHALHGPLIEVLSAMSYGCT